MMIVSQSGQNLENYVMVAIDNFGLFFLADTDTDILELVSEYFGENYMRLFQLFTRLTAVFDACSYIL